MSQPVPPDSYTREYYLSHCQGFEEFQKSRGEYLPDRLKRALSLVKPRPGNAALDIGCGRGEILITCGLAGSTAVGLDYSNDALKLSKDAIARCSERQIPAFLLRADAKFLPLKEELFDIVFMLDVVEHLHPWELRECFDEVFRILKVSGAAVIHTDPNRWRKWVYPIKKIAGPRLFGVAAAKKDAVCKALHVNEQSPISLGRTLRSAGFRYHLWVEAGELKSLAGRGLAGRIVLNIVNKSFLTVLGNEIWAIARKPQAAQQADKRRTSSVSRF